MTLLYAIYQYPLERYPFQAVIREVLGEPDLTRLRAHGRPVNTRETDQQTEWHQRFYAAREVWGPLYHKFVIEFVAGLLDEPFLFQAIPSFRVQVPNNVAVGEFHTDGEYGHPVGETNLWVPLTPADESNSIFLVEDECNGRSIRAWPGDVVVFDGVGRRHGNRINVEGWSRVSFDFRVIPVRLYRETDARSVNMGKRFAPGDYYAAQVCSGRGMPWGAVTASPSALPLSP